MSTRLKTIKTRFSEADHLKPSPVKGKAWQALSTKELVTLGRQNEPDAIEALKYRYNRRLEKGEPPKKAVVEALREFGALPNSAEESRVRFSEADHLRPSPIKGKAWQALSTEELVGLARNKNTEALEVLKYRHDRRAEKGERPNRLVVEALREFGVLTLDAKKSGAEPSADTSNVKADKQSEGVGKADGTAEVAVKFIPEPIAVASAPPTDPTFNDFDRSQRFVIEKPAETRQLVDAGPGTGKTAVACARVAWLADQGRIPPAQIWLISFTRTAIQEIRSRVTRLLDESVANAVQMATLDSMTGQLNARLTPMGASGGNFDDNIRALHGALERYPTVAEYLHELRHLVIDEAQDIVGARADLLVALMDKLPISCGITIFSDEAQAIYGFAAADEDVSGAYSGREMSLLAKLRGAGFRGSFEKNALDQVHRTTDPNLRAIFTQVRSEVLWPVDDALARNLSVRERLKALAHAEAPRKVEEAASSLPDDSFILYRRRIEAIRASAALKRAGFAHRLRISGLQPTISPWIGGALGRAEEHRIGERGFSRLWHDNISGTVLETVTEDQAFTLLRDFAPDRAGRMIDLGLLRTLLATRPPVALAAAEIGKAGPIVGTIHASKGREASSVTLFMPRAPDPDMDPAAINEETRVLFVGATRARGQLRIADAWEFGAARADSGRAYRFDKLNGNPKCDLEIGRIGDLLASGIAGREFFGDAPEVIENQHKWVELAESGGKIDAYKYKFNDQWRFRLCTEYGGRHIGVLGEGVETDLMQAVSHGVKHFNLSGRPRYPKKLDPIGVAGMTTLVVGSGDPEGGLLLEPWKSTGLVLAPVIHGLPRVTIKTESGE